MSITEKVYITPKQYKKLPMFIPRLVSKMSLEEMIHTLTIIKVPNGYIYITRIREFSGKDLKDLYSSTYVPKEITGENGK